MLLLLRPPTQTGASPDLVHNPPDKPQRRTCVRHPPLPAAGRRRPVAVVARRLQLPSSSFKRTVEAR
jgi:hypothetical protein